jgi:hypothetical protein
MKNKRFITLFALSFLVLSLTSCEKKIHGEGPVVTQTRTFGNFTKVFLSVPALLYVTQEPGYKCTIDAQQNILDILQTSVSAGELKIKFDNGKNISSHDKIIIRISAPLYEGLSISGSGDISGTNAFQTTRLQLVVSGSGSILLPETAVSGDIDAFISGSGNIQLNTGVANIGTFSISGSGSMEMLGVTFKTLNAQISGSGNVKATVTQELEAHISGSGSVWYKGSPAINSHVSGSGSVKKVQ